MVEVTSYADAREAFRHRDLRQALYDDGHRLMSDVIVNLHGDEHIARRRLENRLFRRDTFAWYEHEHIPEILDRVIKPAAATGSGELLDLARRAMIRLSVDVAGVDVDDTAFERFYGLMNAMAAAATVVHAVGDVESVIKAGDEALATFDRDFYQPSRARRLALIEADQPARDVLTTLLVNQDELDLASDTVLREVAYYPWVGAHSTSAQLVHAMHHLFDWIEAHPADSDLLTTDDVLRQRFVHESMRLHPASPVAVRRAMTDLTLKTGVSITRGEMVTVNVEQANRDPLVFGDNADEFDPYRPVPEGVARWGLSFGSGTHACVGRALAAGLEAHEVIDYELVGTVSLMAGRLLASGAAIDPTRPAELDTETTRSVWGCYPVIFDPERVLSSRDVER